jgi:hypothetical protein
MMKKAYLQKAAESRWLLRTDAFADTMPSASELAG